MGGENATSNGAPEFDLDEMVTLTDGSTVTVGELHARVSMLEPQIVLMREIEHCSVASLKCMGDAIEQAAAGVEAFGLILDLAETSGSSTSEYRSFIPKHFGALHARSKGRLKLVAVVSTSSLAARIATKFVVGRMAQIPFTVEATRDNAVAEIHKALAKG